MKPANVSIKDLAVKYIREGLSNADAADRIRREVGSQTTAASIATYRSKCKAEIAGEETTARAAAPPRKARELPAVVRTAAGKFCWKPSAEAPRQRLVLDGVAVARLRFNEAAGKWVAWVRARDGRPGSKSGWAWGRLRGRWDRGDVAAARAAVVTAVHQNDSAQYAPGEETP